MKNIKFAALGFLLSSCTPPVVIVDKIDEFNKTRVCRLEPYKLRVNSTLSTTRTTSLSIVKEQNELHKALIQTRITRNLFLNYDLFPENPKINFSIMAGDHKLKDFNFVAHDLSTTHDVQRTYGAYGIVTTTPIISQIISFGINSEQLKSLAQDNNVKFEIEAGNDPITGDISDNTKNAINQYLTKCGN